MEESTTAEILSERGRPKGKARATGAAALSGATLGAIDYSDELAELGGGPEEEVLAARQGKVLDLRQGVVSAATAQKAGELFEYVIKTPVTLARQSSALLPIIGQAVDGHKASIYNQSIHAKHPLNGYRLTNTSALHLMQGPITVFDGGAYAGDARIEDIPPGQDRAISYALDLKTEVESLSEQDRGDLVSVSIRRRVLFATFKQLEEKIYHVKNRDQNKKSVLIEHPFRSEWKLIEPAQPTERTRDVYRFAMMIEAGQSAKLKVCEERPVEQSVSLAEAGTERIAHYINAKQVSLAVKEALQRVVSLRDHLGQTGIQRASLERQIKEISQEQERIRENMAKLAQNSELYARYVKKLDEQETAIEKLHNEIKQLRTREEEQQRELNDYLLDLNLA